PRTVRKLASVPRPVKRFFTSRRSAKAFGVERSQRTRVKQTSRHLPQMSRTNNKLQIGIVGAGAIVRDRHLPGLKKHPEVEIVAVSNSTYESAEKFCQENAP